MKGLPGSVADIVAGWLGSRPDNVWPLGGGDASSAARVEVAGRQYAVKWDPDPGPVPPGWPGMFEAEARGLAELAQSRALRVPNCIAHADRPPGGTAVILLEWLEVARDADRSRAGEALGRALAAQHRVVAAQHGLDHHNYCGRTPQSNRPHDRWTAFFAEERLEFQARLARDAARLPSEQARRLARIIEGIDSWLEDDVQPSLLHGDLWGGNWLVTADGEPAILDPAAYYGDREAELAMCRLFGGFPASFYAAYDEAWPPRAGRDDRTALYQLYHVLNHLNLFGGAYAGHVDAIVRRYSA